MEAVTIKDIARETGLSVATVSRVINDNYPVSEASRKRVTDAMEKLHYRPNAIARSLRSNRSNLIALVVADLSNRFFMEAAKGLEEELGRHGYNLVIASSDGKPEKESKLLETLVERRVDGLCIASVNQDGDSINNIIAGGTPVVLIDRGIEHVRASQVRWNDDETARMLTNILIENGHRDIAMVNVTLSHMTGQNRLKGFESAMREAGIEIVKEFVSSSGFSSDDAYSFVKRVLSKKKKPTGFVCANNVMAEGTIRAMKELNLKIGCDVSIVSFGYLESNKYLEPQITCAELNSRMMGRKAGMILLDQIRSDGVESTQLILKSEFKPGKSVVKLG